MSKHDFKDLNPARRPGDETYDKDGQLNHRKRKRQMRLESSKSNSSFKPGHGFVEAPIDAVFNAEYEGKKAPRGIVKAWGIKMRGPNKWGDVFLIQKDDVNIGKCFAFVVNGFQSKTVYQGEAEFKKAIDAHVKKNGIDNKTLLEDKADNVQLGAERTRLQRELAAAKKRGDRKAIDLTQKELDQVQQMLDAGSAPNKKYVGESKKIKSMLRPSPTDSATTGVPIGGATPVLTEDLSEEEEEFATGVIADAGYVSVPKKEWPGKKSKAQYIWKKPDTTEFIALVKDQFVKFQTNKDGELTQFEVIEIKDLKADDGEVDKDGKIDMTKTESFFNGLTTLKRGGMLKEKERKAVSKFASNILEKFFGANHPKKFVVEDVESDTVEEIDPVITAEFALKNLALAVSDLQSLVSEQGYAITPEESNDIVAALEVIGAIVDKQGAAGADIPSDEEVSDVERFEV